MNQPSQSNARGSDRVNQTAAFDAYIDSGDLDAPGLQALISDIWSEQTPTPLLVHHIDGTITYLNKACAAVLKRSRNDVLATPLGDHFGKDWWEGHHELAMATETSHDKSFATQIRFVVDDVEHLYRIDSDVLSTSDGKPQILCLSMRDITAQAHAKAELQRANQSLKESNRDLEEFAYVASHDLQEPLRKIQAFGERLEGRLEGSKDERALDYLDRMQNASGRMQTLISDLLSFSRVTTTGRELTPVSLTEVVESVLGDLEVAVAEADATIHIGSLPTIDGDRPQLQQLLQNLIGNALKFRATDQKLEIWIEAVIIGPRWLISIRDTGIGFDQGYAEKIFTVFQRLHGRSAYAGTGVGLAICRKIVERHGGTIRAQSADGEGATFLIDLPRSFQELTAAA